MKKIKKSLVVLPAIATMALTTVASVTGTVAWFTAARTATVEGSVFTTTAETGALKVATAALVGTSDPTTEAASSAKITVDGKITHGSYNAQANNVGNLYLAYFGEDGTSAAGYTSLGTVADQQAPTGQTESFTPSWCASSASENKIWYAVAWTMTFTSESTNANDKTHLFFDPTNTKFTDSVTSGSTMQGLRIAFMTSSKFVVVGGAEASDEKHVTGTDKESVASFTAGSYYKAEGTLTKAADAAKATLESHKGYLGAIDSANGLTVTAVAWYEGEDASVVNDAIMSSVTASLAFYARKEITA